MERNIAIFEMGYVLVTKEEFGLKTIVTIRNKNNINNIYKTYNYKNISQLHEIKYLSWENLNCCGYWPYDEEYLLYAVQNNNKLYSSFKLSDSEMIYKLVAGMEDNLNFGIENEDKNLCYICKKGCVADYIDIDEVFRQYELLGIIELLGDDIWQLNKYMLKKGLCSIEISEFKNRNNEFFLDYNNPVKEAQLIFTGLLLGYPIETTMSLLEDRKKKLNK